MTCRALHESAEVRDGRRKRTSRGRVARWRVAASLAMVLLGVFGLILYWGGIVSLVEAIGFATLVLCGAVALVADRRAVRSGTPGLRHAATLIRFAAPVALALLVLTAPSDEELLARGQDIVSEVDAFAAAHGRLPETLAEAEVANPLTRYGRWRYRRGDDPAGYRLDYGDYFRDGFSLHYGSDERDFRFDR